MGLDIIGFTNPAINYRLRNDPWQ